ncbi:hypothetical protein ABT061_08250 [Streptosporangium sp. NPDC002544]|uniref:hypothetical protein n=1 Tax=Streptosporangium sp. NPDC002544 TaxID=3154538 RepID=UPI003333E6A1
MKARIWWCLAAVAVFLPTMFISNCGWVSESTGHCGQDMFDRSGIGLPHLALILDIKIIWLIKMLFMVDAFILVFAILPILVGLAAAVRNRWSGRISLLVAGVIAALGTVNVLCTALSNWVFASGEISVIFGERDDPPTQGPWSPPSSVWLGLAYLLGAVLLVIAFKHGRSEPPQAGEVKDSSVPEPSSAANEAPHMSSR